MRYHTGDQRSEGGRTGGDQGWMTRVVMAAKNVYVWLDQLSKQYRRPIRELDQIPDRALDTLASRGFTALWLIGVWERSAASRRIKRLCGNSEALGSAYSLLEYTIAADLGGEEALAKLKGRAWKRGIRLVGDVVANHTGIDAPWVIRHPDWFIALDQAPFPSYCFRGPDLSRDGRIAIYLEDHYYDHSDAAVVFKRVDRRTGGETYIYHGNDGTGIPWNDTAQLNLFNPELRQALIRTIVQVAQRFPIIRLDTAMTLTRKHYRRLWFPEPGTEEAVPSRAGFGMTGPEFDARMPEEFWRSVMDRLNREAPDTMLLAEAFWLLEEYFLRTLGVQGVYNSAFMYLLANEENAKYRQLMRNILESDPRVLQGLANYMSNPDEESAVVRFGRENKYFGVCLLMSTLPGIPLFDHGQIEGFAERYGMDSSRAYRAEQPDTRLIQRHSREVFPLLRRRDLFAGIESFLLYDFVTPQGRVDEDVFAYSNGCRGERALVVYHNRAKETRGWLRPAGAPADAELKKGERLVESLRLSLKEGASCILHDHLSGQACIQSNRELLEQGIYLELGAYEYHCFQVRDSTRHPLAAHGKGFPQVEETR